MPTDTYVQYKRQPIVVEREFGVEGAAPDTQALEAGGTRTVTIRPRKLILRTRGDDLDRAEQVVDDVSLEGRQVRKADGALSNSRVFCWSANGWRGYEAPPPWIMEIITAEGLRYGDE